MIIHNISVTLQVLEVNWITNLEINLEVGDQKRFKAFHSTWQSSIEWCCKSYTPGHNQLRRSCISYLPSPWGIPMYWEPQARTIWIERCSICMTMQPTCQSLRALSSLILVRWIMLKVLILSSATEELVSTQLVPYNLSSILQWPGRIYNKVIHQINKQNITYLGYVLSLI